MKISKCIEGAVLLMTGLKREGEKFERFWKLIQEQAEKENCKFFMECGEGRELVTDEISGEDIFGWLVPISQEVEFKKEWTKKVPVLDAWDNCLCIAEWTQIGNQIYINFSRY